MLAVKIIIFTYHDIKGLRVFGFRSFSLIKYSITLSARSAGTPCKPTSNVNINTHFNFKN